MKTGEAPASARGDGGKAALPARRRHHSHEEDDDDDAPLAEENDRENEHDDTHDGDGGCLSYEKEERLKVVVRVRPLQKKEEPWASTDSAQHENEMDEQEIQTAAAAPSNRKRRPTASTVATGSSAAAVATTAAPVAGSSTLRMHKDSIMWEKNGQTKMLLADAVFDGNAAQEEVFHSVQDCVDGLFAGFDCSVFAYGQTGTGKTHTMSGLPPNGDMDDDEDEDDEEDDTSHALGDSYGVVPRAIHKLFDQIHKERDTQGGVSFAVYCSFVEIYNEKIYDILSSDLTPPPPMAATSRRRDPRSGGGDPRAGWNRAQPSKEAPSLSIRQKLDGSVFVDGLTSRKISSRRDMLRAFREGSMNREVRDNLYNQHSSRGHSIFQVTLRKNIPAAANSTSPNKSPNKRPPSSMTATATATTNASATAVNSSTSRLSRLFFVDLAGSEKWHVNGSDLTDKYATELASINKSLSALTSCVLALTQKERTHVPYRDSVLTRLLQSCLQGQGRTAFIVTISPSRESLEESFATLRFAERLKALRCRPLKRKAFANELMAGEQRLYYEKQILSMRAEVNRLRELLKKAQRRNQEIADGHATTAANSALVEENRRLKELLMHSEQHRLMERVSGGGGGSGDSSKRRPMGKVMNTTAVAKQKMISQVASATARPFSEEGATARTTGMGDSVVDDGGGGRQASDHASTPQPRRRRPHPLPPDQADTTTTHGGGDGDGGDAPSSTTKHEEDEKQFSTLVTRLQDQEARLNWMLEAEMEAHNTQTQPQTSDRVRVSSSRRGDDDEEAVVVASSSRNKPLATRSWAVERALQRNLAVVPTPVRGGAATHASSLVSSSGDGGGGVVILRRSLPVSVSVPVRSTEGSKATNAVLVRQRHGTHDSHRDRDSGEGGGDYTSAKYDSPRRPTRATETGSSYSTGSGDGSASVHWPRASQQPQQQRAQPRTTKTVVTPPHMAGDPPPAAVKSSAILKLVGSTTMTTTTTTAGDKMVKSKDQLVDDYKRARRAELEAMLRTMVHR